MNKLLKRALVLTVALCLILSFTLTAFAAAPSVYSTEKNSGERDVICTTLDGTSADEYYTGSYTYDNLDDLSASALLSALRTLMTSTHSYKSSYNDCRDLAPITDCENENGKILTLYTSYTTTSGAFDGGNGWNREHVWPKSLGGFNTSGPGADLHHIRPTENKTNSNRDNRKYGEVSGGSTSKGNLSGLVGGTYNDSYYEPLDNVKGDVARICLYVYVRWGGDSSYSCGSITKVFGSIDTLLEWCEMDPVDTWEMGRNEVVGDIQGNRNVFIDYPELAWLIFGKDVPNDMVTPSGIAMNGTQGGSNNDNNNNDNNNDNNTDSGNTDSGNTDSGNNDNTNDNENGSTGSDGNESSGSTTPCEHKDTMIINKKDATCSVTGYTGDTECRECRSIIAKGEPIAPTEHSYGEEKVTKEPTSTEEGEAVQICEHCENELIIILAPTGEAEGFFTKLIAIFKEFFASIAELFGMGD